MTYATTTDAPNLIYGLWDPRFEDELQGLRYVGQSSIGMKRPLQHAKEYNLKADLNTHKVSWIRLLQRLGLEPRVVVLCEVATPEELDTSEVAAIAARKALGCDLLNLTEGGGGRRGFEQSDATKQKISEAKSGVPLLKTIESIEAQVVLPPIWTPLKAWWLGMVYGRGCVRNEADNHYYTISFTSTDRSLVAQWGSVLGISPDKIRARPDLKSHVLDVYDIRIASWLSTHYGMDSKFEGSLKPPSDLPIELTLPFLRGIWDARGSTQMKHKPSGPLPCVMLRFNSEYLIDWLIKQAPWLIKSEVKVPSAGIKAYNATRIGKEAVAFLRFLYPEIETLAVGSSTSREAAWKIVREYEKLASTTCSKCGNAASFGRDLCHSCLKTKWAQASCACGTSPVVAKGMCRRCYNQHHKKHRSWNSAAVRQLEEYTTDWPRLPPEQQESDLSKLVHLYKGRGFPDFAIDTSEDDPLRRVVCGAVDLEEEGVIKGVSSVGQRTCLRFHPHRLDTKHEQSAVSVRQAFDSENHLRAAIKLQLRYGDPVVPKRVYRAMCATLHAPANFPPSLARWFCDEYAPNGGTVLDPCSGFGGRALGVLASEKHLRYLGFDVEPKSVAGTQAMCTHLGCSDRVVVSVGSVEDTAYPSSDLAITSPPYYDTEHYGDYADARLRPFTSVAHWMEGFLRVLIRKALTSAPLFVLNIGAIKGCDLPEEAIRIAVEEGFKLERRWTWKTSTFGSTGSKERLLLFAR